MRSTGFFEEVYAYIRQIPKGKVATYGQIACAMGRPRAARQVGYALHVNPQPFVIPCHRVVNRFGGLAPAFAFGGQEVQAQLLRDEGVTVDENYTVDLKIYLYQGKFQVGETRKGKKLWQEFIFTFHFADTNAPIAISCPFPIRQTTPRRIWLAFTRN